jgi:uncharacterized sulfatase
LLDSEAAKVRQYVYGECFTIRSQTLDDPAANVLWRWITDGRWRLILPRTFQADGLLKSIPRDNYLTPDLQATLAEAKPLLFDLQSDPQELNNLADERPELVATLRAKLDANWTPKVRSR